MSSTLSEGVRVPDIGSVNWGADVNFNWGLLNTALANISGNVKTNVANTWTATQTFTETISGSIDGIAARAVGDEDGNNIKAALAGKQPSLSQSQLDACNSGITAAKVQQITDNANAIASKAADNAVVHLAGAETITGDKTWTGPNTFQYTVTFKDAAAVSAGGYGAGLNFFDYAGNRYGYIQPHVTSGGTKNIVFGNSASGYLEFSSSLVPYASGVLPLGTNAFRWNGIFDANSIFVYNAYTFGTAPSNNRFWGLWNRDSTGVEVVDFLACAYSSGSNSAVLRCLNTDGTNTYDRRLELVVATNGTAQLKPYHNAQYGLGSGSYKWKTLNGINPGALGFQNFNAGITLDTTNWDMTGKYGADANFWTPTVNGWLTVLVNGTPGSGWVQLSQADSLGQFSVCLSTGYAWATIPVIANWQCKICLLCSTVNAKFYPCLGNV